MVYLYLQTDEATLIITLSLKFLSMLFSTIVKLFVNHDNMIHRLWIEFIKN